MSPALEARRSWDDVILGLNDNDARVLAHQLLDRLPRRELRVICSRYGINVALPLTRDAISTDEGVSVERIRQIEFKAMCRMRKLVSRERYL